MSKYLVMGVAATAGVAGLSTSLSGSEEDSVATRIKSSILSKEHLKLVESGGSDYWVKFKELYKNFKGEKLVGVSESTLPQWCEDILKSKVSSREQKEIDFASKWCVVDIRSLKEVVKSSGKNLISDLKSTEQAEAYKKAGDYYKDNKGTKNLAIVDSKFTSSEKTTNTDGGPALQVGCTDKESKLMYEYGGEDQTLEKYTTGCVKQSA